MTWVEVRGRTYHLTPIDKLIPDAQNRLRQLKLDDMDTLARFSVQGLPRVWGFRRGNAFCVLWYDPKHEVYKTNR